MEKRAIDWESIERDYRVGILSVREIGAQHQISGQMVHKRAKKDGWDRDLAAKIKAKAQALVDKAVVDSLVDKKESVYSERITVESNAAAVAAVQLRHKSRISKLDELVAKLIAELEESGEDFKTRVGCAKALGETLKSLIGMEREAWNLDAAPDAVQDDEEVDDLEVARRFAFLFAKAAHQMEVVH